MRNETEMTVQASGSDSPTAFDKRSLAVPSTVELDLCPACQDYGVPRISNRPYSFCLQCGWSSHEDAEGSSPPV